MATEEKLFRNRARADSFGSVAEQYDRFRPSYPDALIDALVALGPAKVLDVGCGTGKATRLLAARGLDILGVELDARMAAVARDHGLSVEVGSFEEWDDAGRTFDLITSAQAWHWVDPERAVPKAARLLRAGGHIAIFWNHDQMRDPMPAIIDAVWREHAPELLTSAVTGKGAQAYERYAKPFDASGLFEPMRLLEFASERRSMAADWVAEIATHSNVLQVEPERRERMFDAFVAAIDAIGGSVTSDVGTYLFVARRV